jgi:hypothetical protein
MDTLGLDLHKRESAPCILTSDGEPVFIICRGGNVGPGWTSRARHCLGGQ